MPWTDYGKQQIFAVGVGAQDMPALYVALFSTSADPATPPVELTLTGYSRQMVVFSLRGVDDAINTSEVDFGPLTAGAYTGVQILDDATAGGTWFWADEGSAVTISAGSIIPFTPGDLNPTRA